MAKPRKPTRNDFPRGLKGDRMYQVALTRYNRALKNKPGTLSKINLSINKAVEGAVSKVKADVKQFNRSANEAVGIYHTGSYKDGDIVTKNGKQYRFNASTKQFVPVKPKPRRMSNIDPKEANAPVNVEARKPKPKPKPDQPAAAQPKPKPKPQPKTETVDGKTVKRVGPVSTPADKPKINKLKIEKATASTEKAYLKYLQEQAKKKSLEQAKKNRARGSRPRGPRG